MQRVYDKHGQLVKEYEPNTIRGRVFIMPFRMAMTATKFQYPDLWKHEGGRVEFKRDGDWDWVEVRRSYETWYHNPWTGETWDRKPVDPELYLDKKLEWSYA